MASLILQNIMPCFCSSFWNVVAILTLSNTTSTATVGIMFSFFVSKPNNASRSCNGTPNLSNVSSISGGISSLFLNLGAE